jgi:hypothetical protein
MEFYNSKVIKTTIVEGFITYKTQLESKANFLDHGQIQSLKAKIENLQFHLRNDEEEQAECFDCVSCKTVPQSKNGELIIYSCQEDHLLCNECLPRVEKCPGK